MYKSRLGIWAGAFGIILAIFLGVKLFTWATEEPITFNVYCSTNDNILKSDISNIGGKYRFKLVDSRENADIIIQPSSEEIIQGFTKHKGFVYTPLVMWARAECSNNNMGFTVLEKGTSSSIVYKDLAVFLDALENDKTFEDIGINKKVAEGNVRIYIPNKLSSYYSLVKELFMITLNDGKVPTEEERKALDERVNKLLTRCDQVEDVGQTILDLYNKNNKDYTIFIGPESLIARDDYAFNTTNDKSWMAVYPNVTVAYKYDVYINTQVESVAESALVNSSSFAKRTGYRVYNSSSFADYFNHVVDNITILD